MTVILVAPPAPAPIPEPPAKIVRGDVSIEPTIVDGYESTRESSNVIHTILGRPGGPDVTLRPAQARTGTLTLVFADELASKVAADEHAIGGVFTLQSADRASIVMNYVVNGRIGRALADTTRKAWVVTVDFQEV